MSAAAETCAALLTPPGTGAIGIIRVCGPAAVSVVAQLFRPARGGAFDAESMCDRRVRYGRMIDRGEMLDEVLVSLVDPDSMSAIDITAHGGVRILERILLALEARGVRFRESDKAYVPFPCANRIEREILQALRVVRTCRGAVFLMRQRVALPPKVHAIADRLMTLPRDAETARAEIQFLLARSPAAMSLLGGVSIALMGPPNSGKSTLFNRLVGREAAVVSPHPGTTRDWVSAELDIGGLPVTLIDTAGIRVTKDRLEQSAIAVGQQVGARNGLRFFLWDASDLERFPDSCSGSDRESDPLGGSEPNAAHQRRRTIKMGTALAGAGVAAAWGAMPTPDAVLFNKVDQLSTAQVERIVAAGSSLAVPSFLISAQTGIGFEAVVEWLLTHVGLDSSWDQTEGALFTDRQIAAATEALSQGLQNPRAAGAFLRRTLLESELVPPDH